MVIKGHVPLSFGFFFNTSRHNQDSTRNKAAAELQSNSIKPISALLAFSEGNPPVTGGFPSQRASKADFDVSFVASLNKPLIK